MLGNLIGTETIKINLVASLVVAQIIQLETVQKGKNYYNKESILVDCVDEYVSDTESIYSIISYQDPNDIEEIETNSNNTEFIDSILESSKKYRDKQIDNIE